VWSLTVWHLWVYLPSCLEGSQKIWLNVCYYLYTRHNSTKFLGITSEVLQFYKFKISSGYKYLHVLYIHLCRSTTQSKERKHNIFLSEGKICFMKYLVIKLSCEGVRVRVILWLSPFWCPDPPGVHDQILVFIFYIDYRSVSEHPHRWECRSVCCQNMCQLFLFIYTLFFCFHIFIFSFSETMFSWSISAIHYEKPIIFFNCYLL
jgi:hypothetical protein